MDLTLAASDASDSGLGSSVDGDVTEKEDEAGNGCISGVRRPRRGEGDDHVAEEESTEEVEEQHWAIAPEEWNVVKVNELSSAIYFNCVT